MTPQQIFEQVANAHNKIKRLEKKVEQLKVNLDRLLEFVTTNIRYKIWPTEGLGIGLNVHKMDEILIDCEEVLGAAWIKKNESKRST